MRNYYKTPEGVVGIFWSRHQHCVGTPCIRLRLQGGELKTYEAKQLIWCTRHGVPKK